MTDHDIIIIALVVINIALAIGGILLWYSLATLHHNIHAVYRRIDAILHIANE